MICTTGTKPISVWVCMYKFTTHVSVLFDLNLFLLIYYNALPQTRTVREAYGTRYALFLQSHLFWN